jgi:YwiC-like protein
MLAVPFLLGVAASRPGQWQLVLAVTAVTRYLVLAVAQARLRARRRDGSPVPLMTARSRAIRDACPNGSATSA